MTDILDARTVRGRLRDYGLLAHTQVASLMFSGIFALAALVLLDILRTPDHRALRLSFWLVAIVGEVATLTLQMQRPVLMARSNMKDVPLLVARGLFALAVIALTAPQYGGAEGWRFVYVVVIPLAVVSRALVQDFVMLGSGQRYSSHLEPLAESILAIYRVTLHLAIPQLLLVAALATLVLTAPTSWTFVEPLAFGFNLLVVGQFVNVLLQHQSRWRSLELAIGDAAEAEAAESEHNKQEATHVI